MQKNPRQLCSAGGSGDHWVAITCPPSPPPGSVAAHPLQHPALSYLFPICEADNSELYTQLWLRWPGNARWQRRHAHCPPAAGAEHPSGAGCRVRGPCARHAGCRRGGRRARSTLTTGAGFAAAMPAWDAERPVGFARGSGLSQALRTRSLFIRLREPTGRGRVLRDLRTLICTVERVTGSQRAGKSSKRPWRDGGGCCRRCLHPGAVPTLGRVPGAGWWG